MTTPHADPAAESLAHTLTPTSAPKKSWARWRPSWAGSLAVAALALAGWQWHTSQALQRELQAKLLQREAQADAATEGLRQTLRQTQASQNLQAGQLARVEAQLSQSLGQQQALQDMYQAMARDRDNWVLNDMEQTLVAANQGLQLTGNVRAAQKALQWLDERVARAERPQWQLLRDAIARDQAALRNLPGEDDASLSLRLEDLSRQVDALTVLPPHFAPPAPASVADLPWYRRWWAEVKHELKGVVLVRQMEAPAVMLQSEDQVLSVREHIKLRLLAARVALLQRDAQAYHAHLAQARQTLLRHFVVEDTATHNLALTLEQLEKQPTQTQWPDLQASLQAMTQLKAMQERGVR